MINVLKRQEWGGYCLSHLKSEMQQYNPKMTS